MADIGTNAGVAREDSALSGASKIFAFLWDEAWSNVEKTVAGDADALHDFRVAMRRLRTALQNFEGDKRQPLLGASVRDELRIWRAKIGQLGDKLGAVRDFDVLTDYVREFNTNGTDGLREFEDTLAREREKNFAPMTRKIERAGEPNGVREKFARWSLGLPGIHWLETVALESLGKQVLQARIEETLALGPSLQSGDEELQHELRRSLRRVRYTLETLSPCFDKNIKKPVKYLVGLQDLLGEMQDRTVLQDWLSRSFKHAPEDIKAFAEHGVKRREELLEEVRALWIKREESGLWETLRSLTVTSHD